MKSIMTSEETERLLDEAEGVFPDSEFVMSVREQFDDRGFITDKQESALNNVIDKCGN